MRETYVRLLCPECNKDWENDPESLPAAGDAFDCPSCEASRPTSEFLRTDHDLQTLKELG